MPRYNFSEGEITVEDEIYDPLMDGNCRDEHGGVILIANLTTNKTAGKEKNHDQA